MAEGDRPGVHAAHRQLRVALSDRNLKRGGAAHVRQCRNRPGRHALQISAIPRPWFSSSAKRARCELLRRRAGTPGCMPHIGSYVWTCPTGINHLKDLTRVSKKSLKVYFH